MCCSTILKILQMPAVLHFTFVPEDQMSRPLLLRQILVALHRQQIYICIPDTTKWLRFDFPLGERACFHSVRHELGRVHSNRQGGVTACRDDNSPFDYCRKNAIALTDPASGVLSAIAWLRKPSDYVNRPKTARDDTGLSLAIAASRTPPRLVSGWGCRGRHLSR